MLVYSISLVVKYVHVRTERYMYIRYVLVHHQITWLYMYTYCTIMCIYMYMYNHVHFLCICFVAGDEGSERHRTAQCKAPWIHWGTASDHHWEASWTAGEEIAPILSSQLLFYSICHSRTYSLLLLFHRYCIPMKDLISFYYYYHVTLWCSFNDTHRVG